MKKELGLLALAVVIGLGLTPNGFGQGPPAGAGPKQGPAVQSAGPGWAPGIGFYCPYRQAALGATTGAPAMGFGRGMAMRRGAGMAGPYCPFCPYRQAALGATGAAAGTSQSAPAFVPGVGMRRNAPYAPGTGPFCPFNPNNVAAGNPAVSGTQPGSASGSSQPKTR
ncbi:MAG TPA: hypothetical protein VMT20_16580 [Terriglobia bacterium]|nr:hypothetical protein [Terriglobia bacterium]